MFREFLCMMVKIAKIYWKTYTNSCIRAYWDFISIDGKVDICCGWCLKKQGKN